MPKLKRSMKRPNNRVRLAHMLEASKKAVHLIAEKKQKEFLKDETLVLAVTRLIEILGEAANGVSADFQSKHSSIPWRQIVGARNHLIHGYFDVDLGILWQILSTDLPILIDQLEKIID